MTPFLENAIHILAGWCTVVVRALGMLPSVLAMTNDISTIYYFPIDHEGNETGEAIPVTLKPDGTADVSKLPNELRASLECLGVPNTFRTKQLKPQNGFHFLEALLRETTGYKRFRSSITE